jgi:hypothetical protein
MQLISRRLHQECRRRFGAEVKFHGMGHRWTDRGNGLPDAGYNRAVMVTAQDTMHLGVPGDDRTEFSRGMEIDPVHVGYPADEGRAMHGDDRWLRGRRGERAIQPGEAGRTEFAMAEPRRDRIDHHKANRVSSD